MIKHRRTVAALLSSLTLTAASALTSTADAEAITVDSTTPIQHQSADQVGVGCDLGVTNLNRTDSCFMTEETFHAYDQKTGEDLGTGSISITSTATLNVRDRTWSQHLGLLLTGANGVLTSGLRVRASAQFPDGPGFTTTVGTSADLFQSDQGQTTADYQVSSPGRGIVTGHVQPLLELEPLAAGTYTPITFKVGAVPPLVRCDSTPGMGSRRGGCVYSNYTPTYDVSTSNPDTADVAAHILWAQQNLQQPWGWEGWDNVGPRLTRTTDRRRELANEKAACLGRPEQPGKACNSYPFTDTEEGAATNPDFSWRLVDARQNRLERTKYREPWYQQNRVLDQDQYWVNVAQPGE